MIWISPALGNWTDDIVEPARDGYIATQVSEAEPSRPSSLLGPDGEPLRVDLPRGRMGFVLPHEKGDDR